IKLEQLSSKLRTPGSGVLPLTMKPGIYTHNNLNAAGFQYTGNGDTARCKDCGLEVSNWKAT
ncbi:unnamed protein product, partial [Adineta steineri]